MYCSEPRHKVAFIVRHTSREQTAITKSWRKRGRLPLAQRINRLNIIMIVKAKPIVGPSLNSRKHYRVIGRLNSLYVQACLFAKMLNEDSTFKHALPCCGDTWLST